MTFVTYRIGAGAVAATPINAPLETAEAAFRRKYPRAVILDVFFVEVEK